MLSGFIANNARLIGMIFTDEKPILDMFEKVNLPLAIWMISMNLSVANETILSNMGRSQLVLYLGLIGSWVGQVPGVYLAVTYWKKDVVSLYYGSSLGYVLLCIL